MAFSGSTEPTIQTERFDLVHLSIEEITTLLDNPSDSDLFVGRDFRNPLRVLVDDPGPLHWRVPQVKVDPAVNRWFVRFVVDRQSRIVVGSLSFHGPPDARGMVEIGLGIDEAHRRRGIATEALVGMWSWAVGDPSVHHLRYTVGVDNVASIGVIEKLGFSLVGRQMDEIDGPEDIYEMSADDFRRRFMP